MAIAAPTPNHWVALCKAMGREELIEDERTSDVLARAGNREFTTEQVLAWTRAHTRDEIVGALGGSVPVGPVNTAEDLFNDPHTKVRGILPEIELPGDNGRVALAGTPIKFSVDEAGVYRRPPGIGEHTDEVFAEFGVEPPGARKEKE